MATFKIGDKAIAKYDLEGQDTNGKTYIQIPKGAEVNVLNVDYCCRGQLLKVDIQCLLNGVKCDKCNKEWDADIYIWVQADHFEKPASISNKNINISLEPKTKEIAEQSVETILNN